jgi:sec-independent protein translocase protein TatA
MQAVEDTAMDFFSIWHWMIVIAIVLLLFGRGKISDLMLDIAQGVKAFKKGIAEDISAQEDKAKIDKAVHHQAEDKSATRETGMRMESTGG